MTKEIFNEIKEELPRVLSKYTGYRILNTDQIELLSIKNWPVTEKDGIKYESTWYLILAHESGARNTMGTYFVIKATPFNCYFGEANARSLHSFEGMEKIPNYRDEILTTKYRDLLSRNYGSNWDNSYLSYVDRVRQKEIFKINHAY